MVETKRALAARRQAPAAKVRRPLDENEGLVDTVYQLQRYVGNAQVARAIAQIRRAPAPDSAPAEPAPAPASFNKMSFIALVYSSVDSATPASLPQGTKFADSGAQQVKNLGSAAATQQAQTAQQDLAKVADATPDPKKVIPQAPTPRVPQPRRPKLKGLEASKAVPPPKPTAQVPLHDGPAEINEIMADGKVTDKQLADSNEPQFEAALQAKRRVEHEAHEAPREYRKNEAKLRAGAKVDAIASIRAFVSGARGRITSVMSSTKARKFMAKMAADLKRAEVAGSVQSLYEATRNEVKMILGGLEQKVEERFTKGAEAANNLFDYYIDFHRDKLLDSRYSGIGDTLTWWSDRATGLPEQAFKAIVDRSRELYLTRMRNLTSDLADLVANELNRAKRRIAQGRQEVRAYVDEQTGDLHTVASNAEQDFADQFASLEQDLDEEQNNLAGTLSEKFKHNRDAIDEHTQERIDKNRGFIGDAKALVKGAVQTIKQLAAWLRDVVQRAEGVVSKIVLHPGKFFGNLVDGIKRGFDQFVGHIVEHLEQALFGLVVDTMDGASITLPNSLDAGGILSIVLQVLGLTPTNLRKRAVNFLGEDTVTALEKVPGVISTLQNEGLSGLWNFVSDKFGALKDGLVSEVKQWLMMEVVKKGVAWLAKMLVPFGGFLKACEAIYDTIRFFMKHSDIIKRVVDTILDALESIADGKTDVVAKKIEDALTAILKGAITFLASLLDLDGIGERIKQIINKAFRDPINEMINAALRGAAKVAGPVLNKVRGGIDWAKNKAGKAKEWALSKIRLGFTVGEERHRLFFANQPGRPQVMVASDPQAIATYLKYLKQAIDRVRGHPGTDATIVKQADALHGEASDRAAAAQSDEAATGDGSHAKALLAGLVTPLRQLMSLTARLQAGLGASGAGAGTTVTGDLRVGEYIGMRLTIGGEKKKGKRVARRVAGDQWQAHQVVAITPAEVTLRGLESGSSHKYPMSMVAQDLASASPNMFKRISGPEELAEHGVYVEKGLLKKQYRGKDNIRSWFYPGDYAAYAPTFKAAAKAAAKTSSHHAASGLGPDAWLCPGYNRPPHLVEEPGAIDHRVPVAEHWSKLGGNNTDQDARQAFNTDSSNLQLLCKSCNDGKGSKSTTGQATTYVDSVGALFTGPDGKR